jgi:hypothetical protein
MADGQTKRGSSRMPNREQSDLVVEINKSFDNDLSGAGPALALGQFPGRHDLILAYDS